LQGFLQELFSEGSAMAAKLSGYDRFARISDVLMAYFDLDPKTQKEIQHQLERLSDSGASEADRDRAEQALAAVLRSATEKPRAGRVIGRDERLSAAHRDLRREFDQVEATFAATLEKLMAERQLTQTELARRIGVGQSAISMLLKRRCRPQRRTLGKLAEALGVSVEVLWPGFSTGWRSGVM
jgi:DNA-binding Xre family transcriptional regulator